MKKEIIESIDIPQGIECTVLGPVLTCKKDSLELSKKIISPKVNIEVKESKVYLICKRGNQNEYKAIKSFLAHISNMFKGLQSKFVYRLESCNLHFPMTLKVDKNMLIISNFLGEKVSRHARIEPYVEIEIKGPQITLSSHNREAAGQTAANIEKATKIKCKDRRIFQDGIYITNKPEDC